MEASVVTLRTNKPSLVHALSDEALLLLGAEDVAQARKIKSHPKWVRQFLANLKACLVEGDDCAFPGYVIEKNTTGKEMGGHEGFKGEYLDNMGYA